MTTPPPTILLHYYTTTQKTETRFQIKRTKEEVDHEAANRHTNI